jgi:hypothetical protein
MKRRFYLIDANRRVALGFLPYNGRASGYPSLAKCRYRLSVAQPTGFR